MKKLAKLKLVWYGLSLRPRWGMNTTQWCVLASYHPPHYVAWRWAIYWNRLKWLAPLTFTYDDKFTKSISFGAPIIGHLSFRWQDKLLYPTV